MMSLELVDLKQDKRKIVYVKNGLANFYPDRIEVSIDLKKNRKLLEYVLEHEQGHKEGFDLIHDFSFKGIKLIPFMLTHPRTWIDFSPIQFKKGELIYDLNMIIQYGILVGLVALAFYIF